MDPILDEHIVMKGPELKTLVRARSELVQTFVDFISNSRNAYEESDHAIDCQPIHSRGYVRLVDDLGASRKTR